MFHNDISPVKQNQGCFRIIIAKGYKSVIVGGPYNFVVFNLNRSKGFSSIKYEINFVACQCTPIVEVNIRKCKIQVCPDMLADNSLEGRT